MKLLIFLNQLINTIYHKNKKVKILYKDYIKKNNFVYPILLSHFKKSKYNKEKKNENNNQFYLYNNLKLKLS